MSAKQHSNKEPKPPKGKTHDSHRRGHKIKREDGVKVFDLPCQRTVNVRLRYGGRIQTFDCGDLEVDIGDWVIIRDFDLLRMGLVTTKPIIWPAYQSQKVLLPSDHQLVRIATREDLAKQAENQILEREGLEYCQQCIANQKLVMKLVAVEITLDHFKTIFYYTAEDRVDFRQLVKELVSRFRTRIEMRQIGVRQESLMLGGVGVCGRPYCCAGFLSNFSPVSVKMAKEQNLALNTVKISGVCGRLMCCLAFENPVMTRRSRPSEGKGTVETIALGEDSSFAADELHPPFWPDYEEDEELAKLDEAEGFESRSLADPSYAFMGDSFAETADSISVQEAREMMGPYFSGESLEIAAEERESDFSGALTVTAAEEKESDVSGALTETAAEESEPDVSVALTEMAAEDRESDVSVALTETAAEEREPDVSGALTETAAEERESDVSGELTETAAEERESDVSGELTETAAEERESETVEGCDSNDEILSGSSEIGDLFSEK
ncbi:MAG: hypothetical protein LBJ64_03500 [Deltaproteobacteria bacterium]|jgi:cell fate regulator YaaT (PSP1 superfamily)|nr:hypothetical protein [Deltaproteobacteria bacterium]